MLINTVKILNDARVGKYAVPQFNINNLEWTRFVLETCEEMKSPVILGVSESAARYMGGFKTVYNLVTGLMEDLNIKIPVVLHLDHGKSVESCKKAIDNGFTSVMIDSSSYPLAENIRMTREVVTYGHGRNVSVEGEIGHVGAREDDVVSDICYANVDECITFVNETMLDSLAPAIGNVHGMYKGKAKINLPLVAEIKQIISKPLVLHGGTGISDDDIKALIETGIAKVNINTDLQVVWAKGVREFLLKDTEEYDPRKIIKAGENNIKSILKEKIMLFKSNDKAN